MWLIALLLGTFILSASAQDVNCDYGWTPFYHGCWIKKAFQPGEPKTWFHAEERCKEFHGKMTMFLNQSQYEAAVTQVFNLKADAIWVGAIQKPTINATAPLQWNWPHTKANFEPYTPALPNLFLHQPTITSMYCGIVERAINAAPQFNAISCVDNTKASYYACFTRGKSPCPRNARYVNGTCECVEGWVDVTESKLDTGDLAFVKGEKCVPMNTCDKIKNGSMGIVFVVESTVTVGQKLFSKVLKYVDDIKAGLPKETFTRVINYGGDIIDDKQTNFLNGSHADTKEALYKARLALSDSNEHRIVVVFTGSLPQSSAASTDIELDFKNFVDFIKKAQNASNLRVIVVPVNYRLAGKEPEIKAVLKSKDDYIKLETFTKSSVSNFLQKVCNPYLSG